MKKLLRLLSAGLLLVASLTLTTAPVSKAPPLSDESSGQELLVRSDTLPRPAPDVALTTLQGDTLRLSNYHGRVILLNFWATWCAPCIAEMPDLQALHNTLTPRGFTVIGLSLDHDGLETVGPFATRFGISYPLVLNEDNIAEAFGGILALPTTFLIDREGLIRQRVYGIYPLAEHRPLIESLLDAE